MLYTAAHRHLALATAFACTMLAFALTACGGSGNGVVVAGNGAPLSPVPCSQLHELRDLSSQLQYFTNPRTGDTIPYLVVGDGATSSDAVVMFNGTGEIVPDWPVQLITNSTYSPQIVNSNAYVPSEDGTVSLCHNYHLVMFDYPGVGKSPLNGNVTLDAIANDVDAMLSDATAKFKIRTDRVDPLGWSLGTIAALKYAFLSTAANPGRTIHNLALIASKPGGNTDGFYDGNQAACVATLFDTIKDNPNLDPLLKFQIQTDLFELTFPYAGQGPNNGPSSGCTATVNVPAKTVSLNVTLNCPLGSECAKQFIDQGANRMTSPWSITGGIDYNLFVQQRELADDYSLCYCPKTSGFTSQRCTCSGSAPEMSSSNGGVCQTVSPQPNAPVSTNCVDIHNTGTITVINGPEDLLIQWLYGQELVVAYQQMYGPAKASLVTYPGSDGAGHGVMLQHPLWTQEQLAAALAQ